MRTALKAVPLFLFIIADESFDNLVGNLEANNDTCKLITGLSGKALRTILTKLPKERVQAIKWALAKFRDMEREVHDAFQTKIKLIR